MAIEKVQMRATKVPTALRELSYKDRLKKLGLSTLNQRRVRGDLIEMFKVLKGMEPISWERNPLIRQGIDGPASAVRGNSMRLIRESFKAKIRNDFASAVTAKH